MAIAFDSATNPVISVSGTTLTFAHTCTGADRKLFVGVFARNLTVSSVTYGGDSLTEIGVRQGPQGGSNDYISMFYLDAPSSGSNNVVVTLASGGLQIAGATSYTGCGTGIDAFAENNNTSESTTTTTLTTTVDNAWVMGMVRGGSSANTSASTGTVTRANTNNFFQMYDKNAPVSPAGSASIVSTQSNQSTMAKIASFAPAGGGGGGVIQPRFKGFSRP